MSIISLLRGNSNEGGLQQDYEKWLEESAPHAPTSQYLHRRTEDNADAHLKRNAKGSVARNGPPSGAVVVAVTNGRLYFGTWQRTFYGESYGRRRKRVLVPTSSLSRLPTTLIILPWPNCWRVSSGLPTGDLLTRSSHLSMGSSGGVRI